jgi:hypothetical protein
VGRGLFPKSEAALLADVVRRDRPFYDSSISRASVDALNRFAQNVGILKSDVPFEHVVTTRIAPRTPSACYDALDLHGPSWPRRLRAARTPWPP